MRLFSILAALLVGAAIYAFVMERDWLLSLVNDAPADASAEMDEPRADAAPDEDDDVIGVVALHSAAREIDSAVILRGQTEADRQVELRAETTGQIVSPPLRKGAFVEEGEVLCRLDPGTRQAMSQAIEPPRE